MDEMDLSGLDLPEKEKKILQAAIGVFSEKGYSASTTSEIAKNAGIAEGTIFRYYKTKKDILRGILIQMINMVSGKLIMEGIEKIFENAEDKDLHSILKEVLYDRLKLAEKVMPMFRIIVTEALYHEDVREAIYQNIVLKALDTVSAFHKKISERGLIRIDIPPVALLRSVIGSIAPLIGQKLLFGNKFALEDFESEVDMAIDILINGITPRNP